MKNFCLVTFAILFFYSCSNSKKEFSEINGFTQGTTYHIVFENVNEKSISLIRQEAESILKDVDNSLSIYNDSSVISLINRNLSDQTDTLFRDVFRQSEEVWRLSSGAFDITIGPLVKAWGFGPDALKRFDETKLDSLLALVGMEKVTLEGDRITKADQDMFLDVNAIAQGYTVDLLAEYFITTGINNCLIEVGGEVRALGKKDGKGWHIGIDKPVDGNYIPGSDMKAIIRLDDISLATSGNYRKFYVDNGVKYSHTINPQTGYPSRHTLLSATILAPDCSTADAWATACMVVGTDSARNFFEKYDFLKGYLIFSDENGNMKTWMSPGMSSIIEEQ